MPAGDDRERRAAALALCFLRRQGGASAVEFSLLAPLLIISLLTAVDLGFAAYDRMTLDTIVRSSAQSAMGDPGRDGVFKVLRTIASAHYAVADPAASAMDQDAITLAVERSCACPENPALPVPCSTLCTASEPPSVFYRLSAAKNRSTIIVPRMSLTAALEVQAR